ncbi:hypothetical protein BJV82DRAFT_575284 [Fennellomyces sp. T-0311]|nr:hypothetical protein BJV82DRAFT_575284 [Fennellomyces sp. T-0311]
MGDRTLSKRKPEIFVGRYSEQENSGQHLKRYRKSTPMRQAYTHLTLCNVSIPLEYQHIRRFTSGGKYLITFTPCYHGISLYSFMNATYTPATASDRAPTHRNFNHSSSSST